MPLNREQVLAAALDVVRRHGPEKATVVDVAAALGVSHGSIYRFFPTKAALREAVVAHWLQQITDPLERLPQVADPVANLRLWFDTFYAQKRRQKAESPELFDAFRILAGHEPGSLQAYKEKLAVLLEKRVEYGMEAGAFDRRDARRTAEALIAASTKFHHPFFAAAWDRPETQQEFELLWDLLITGLGPERNRS